MLFDAPEKKCELRLHAGNESLRSLGRNFWERVVRDSRAKILSLISNDTCDAYLLSESSLFVYDYKCLMITCGQTDLAKAMSELMYTVGVDKVQWFIYERKIGHFPKLHPFQIEDDYKLLSNHLPLERFAFNKDESSPIHFFFYQNEESLIEEDTTVEILMHELDVSIFDQFSLENKELFKQSQTYQDLKKLLSGFKCDEYFFDPCGYSLNAIKDQFYITIHVTPQNEGSYVSFETNVPYREEELKHVVAQCVRIFKSNVFDVVSFDTEKYEWEKNVLEDYELSKQQEHSVENLFQVECRRYKKIVI